MLTKQQRGRKAQLWRALRIVSALLAAAMLQLPAVTHAMAQRNAPTPLVLETKIPLGNVRGRIDHMAIDLARQRLFVAELGNNSVGVVDLAKRIVIHTITGLRKPQGVAYLAPADVLYVANAGDGSVRLFRGEDYAEIGRIELGEDADNIRIDADANRLFVGYGSGALGVIDPESQRKIGDVGLKAHPESFQLAATTTHIFVNLPDARSIAVVDRSSLQQIVNWPTGRLAANFAMALDENDQHLLVAFRHPPKLAVFSVGGGVPIATMQICGDADDVFVDSKRHRAYVSCGEGFVDVVDIAASSPMRIAHVSTASGARTSLFIPALDRLVVASPARAGSPAGIWVFRPTS